MVSGRKSEDDQEVCREWRNHKELHHNFSHCVCFHGDGCGTIADKIAHSIKQDSRGKSLNTFSRSSLTHLFSAGLWTEEILKTMV